MERRKTIRRVSSASALPFGRWPKSRAFQAARCRPASASSLDIYSSSASNIPCHLQTNILKRHHSEWALSDLDLSPNIRRAIAVATKYAYRSIQNACKDPSLKPSLAIRKENRADLLLDRFLENIRSVKANPSFDENRPTTAAPGGNSSDQGHIAILKTKGRCDQVPSKIGNSRPVSASTRGSDGNRQSDAERIALDAALERRERIRNRSLHIEQHVLEARDRIRRAHRQRQAEIDSITAAFESKRMGELFDRKTAVLAAKHRIYQWKAHRKDDI